MIWTTRIYSLLWSSFPDPYIKWVCSIACPTHLPCFLRKCRFNTIGRSLYPFFKGTFSFLNGISSHRENAKMRDFSFRENPSYETDHRDVGSTYHIILFKLSNARAVWSLVRCFQAGNCPGRGGKKYSWNDFLKSVFVHLKGWLPLSHNLTIWCFWSHIIHPFT